jgi:ATP-dependent helicase/nuclease subunit A
VILSQEQSAAVSRLGQDVCVVAGPGSGKTRVLVERFRCRVEQGVSPLRLLTVTFTEKAANELKDRLARDFAADDELREQIERAPVYTIDAFCANLLRRHAIEAGLDPQFEVLDASDARAELTAAAEEALDDLLESNPTGVRALFEALDVSDAVDGLVRVYEAMRLTAPGMRDPGEQAPASDAAWHTLLEALRGIAGAAPHGWNQAQLDALASVQQWARQVLSLDARVTLDHFRALAKFKCDLRTLRRGDSATELVKKVKSELLVSARQALIARYYAPERALLWEALDRLDRIYGERKQALRALDFSDLEEHTLRLLRDNDELRARVRESFDEVLMDELQDTNPLQAALIDRVRRPDRFFAVGDINQSIYGFRHADPSVFRTYRDGIASSGKPVDRLKENYRSRAAILRATDAVTGGAPGIEPNELVAKRKFAAKTAPSVEVIAALGETTEEAARLEARLVARRIRELEGALEIEDRKTHAVRPAALADMAVLVRNVNALPAIEQALDALRIPYLITRGKHFYEAQEVTDLVHLLRVIANPRDEASMVAVLRSPLAGASAETLFRLKQRGNLGAALAWLEPGPDSAEFKRLLAFRSLLAELRAQADYVSPDRLLARAMDASDYESTLTPRLRANVRKLLAGLRSEFERRPQPVSRLVEQLEFLRDSDPDEPTAPPEDSSNAVRLMTVHSAKGLEFPVVFLAAMHKGTANDSPPLAYSTDAGLVARWRDPVSGESVKDLAYAHYSDNERRRAGEEESRLLYVGMTRAEEHLVLSFAKNSRNARNWAERVVAGFGLELAAENEPRVLECAGLEVRFLCADQCPPEEAGTARPARAGAGASGIPEDFIERPAVSGQHNSSASPTSIAVFESCPRRYYLGRYLGWRAERRMAAGRENRERVSGADLGSQVHDLLANIPVENAADLAVELARKFRASELGRRAEAATRIEREFDFLVALEGTLIEGRIDLWFEEGGELVIVDYKTDDVDAAGAAERAGSYALQLQLYALALEKFTGRLPGRAVLAYLRPDITVPVPLAGADLEGAREAVRRFIRAQNELCFPKREGEHCRRCDYYGGLCR